jgi:hypothetical protein
MKTQKQQILLYKGSPLSRHESAAATLKERDRLLAMDESRGAELFTVVGLVELYRQWLKDCQPEPLWKELAFACCGEAARKLFNTMGSWSAAARECAIDGQRDN